MSILDITKPRDLITGGPAQLVEPMGFFEGVGLSERANTLNRNFNSSSMATREATKARDELFEKLSGESVTTLYDPTLVFRESLEDGWYKHKDRIGPITQKKIDEEILKRRKSDPRFNDVKTWDEVQADARNRARLSQQEYDRRFDNTDGLMKYLSAFTGNAISMMKDPVQVMSMGFGAGAASGILRTAAIEFGIGAATELAIQPEVMRWQKEVGNKYGIDQALLSVITAGLGAGAIGGTFKAASRSFAKVSEVQFSKVLDKVSQIEGLNPKIKTLIDEMKLKAEERELTPSRDTARHQENVQVAARSLDEGKMPDIQNTRIIDEIDGLPKEAFGFFAPEAKFRVGAESIPVEKMKPEQITQVVTENLLPKISREIAEDLVREQFQVGAANVKRLNSDIKMIQEQVAAIADNKKKQKKVIRENFKGQKGKVARKEEKRQIDEVNKQYRKQEFDLSRQKMLLENKLDRVAFQKERKAAVEQMKQGKIPDGDDYTSTMIRDTLDKVVEATKQGVKINKAAKSARVKTNAEKMKNIGASPVNQLPYQRVLEMVQETEKGAEGIFSRVDTDFNSIPDDAVIFDEAGNQMTKKQIKELFANDEAEQAAINFCSIGGAR